GALGENHPERLSLERTLGVLTPLHAQSEVERCNELGLGQVGDNQEVTLHATTGGGRDGVGPATGRIVATERDANKPRHQDSRRLSAIDSPTWVTSFDDHAELNSSRPRPRGGGRNRIGNLGGAAAVGGAAANRGSRRAHARRGEGAD